MATDQHPITPPLDKFARWVDDILNDREDVDVVLDCAWKDGYRAGADAELEACCKLLDGCRVIPVDGYASTAQNRLAAVNRVARLRAARRPKPPSLAVRALIEFESHQCAMETNGCDTDLLRTALERLQQLEQENNDN